MPQLSERARGYAAEGLTFVKWLLYSCLTGVVVGLVAVAFHLGIDLATELRGEHPSMIWLLPLSRRRKPPARQGRCRIPPARRRTTKTG